MFVTTEVEPDQITTAKAQEIAAELEAAFVPRGTHTLTKMMQRRRDSELIKVASHEIRWIRKGSADFFFHPSMSAIRVLRLARGESDAMLHAIDASPGDHIVDCTMGMASDAIVMSYAVGPKGSVTALESSRIVHVLVREGLKLYGQAEHDVTEAMRRIVCKNVPHLEYLRSLPDSSVDIVYFDPMFRQPEMESQALMPLRTIANPEPVCQEAVLEAMRVAKKRVVLKEKPSSGEFERLGFLEVVRTGNKTAYGVIRTNASS